MSLAGDLRRRARTLLNLSTVPTNVWDKQFADGTWDMLDGPDEEAHYRVIASFYEQFCVGSVLDIGCGLGTLLPCLRGVWGFDNSRYCGTDISPVAIAKCRDRYPGMRFEVNDYNRERFDFAANVIVFNETLSYFSNPLRTVQKAFDQNLILQGRVIVSLCDSDEHAAIWAALAADLKCLAAQTVENDKGQIWTVRVFTD